MTEVKDKQISGEKSRHVDGLWPVLRVSIDSICERAWLPTVNYISLSATRANQEPACYKALRQLVCDEGPMCGRTGC